jgi:uncharacterized RDD family membrane protein YckC
MNNELASLGDRLLATLIDSLVGMALIVVAAGLMHLWEGAAVLGLLAILGLIAYQCMLLVQKGQTIGKAARGIRIVKLGTQENGGFMTNILLRSIANAVLSVIPFYALVDILFIFREDRRCLHDLLAGTEVIKDAVPMQGSPRTSGAA